jgi:ribonuclease HI
MKDGNTLGLDFAAPSLPSAFLYTDGACVPNPGNGGWCAKLICGTSSKLVYGCEPNTTNNRAEMIAVIEGLRAFKVPTAITLRSDSMICINLVNGVGKKAHKRQNQDLVQAILREMERHQVKAEWIRGHNGDPANEECDGIAEELARTGTTHLAK